MRLLKRRLDGSENRFLLSAYLPVLSNKKSDIETYVRSPLQDCLVKRNSKYKDVFMEHVINDVTSLIDTADYVPAGLAIFGIFDEESLHTHKERDEFTIVDMNMLPIMQINMDTIFDADQLIWYYRYNPPVTILILDRCSIDVYKMREKSPELVESVKNKLPYEMEKDYREQFSPTRGLTLMHGTGDDNYQRHSEMQDYRFAKLSVDKVKQLLEKLPPSRYSIILYSSHFKNMINKIAKLYSFISTFQPILSLCEIKNEKNLEKDVRSIMREHILQEKFDLLDDAKFHHPRYIDNWQVVLEASRNGQIGTLFVRSGFEVPGYVYQNELLYDKPYENAVRVDDVVAWLIRKVVLTGGNVEIFKENELPHSSEFRNGNIGATALLRF